MPTLHWIGKEKVVNHYREVPYRILEHQYGFSAELGKQDTPLNSGNKVIHGDNLEALKSLLPEYEGKIKCIYIDPPYNTGNEKWVYNDNVNHPKIKKWLGEIVGKQGEDLTRHDKWLCMMYPRLKLLHKLLADDGAIFISIDENEQANLKLICFEFFGIANFVGEFIWKARSGKGGTNSNIAIQHEYIFVFSKNINKLNIKTDKRIGKKRKEQLRQWGQGDKRIDRPTMFFPIFLDERNNAFVTVDDMPPNDNDIFEIFLPIKSDGSDGRWRVNKSKVKELIENKQLIFKKNDKIKNVYRLYLEGNITESAINSLILDKGTASNGTLELKQIFGDKVFDTTKPIDLIKYLVGLIVFDDPNSIILDSFAGSGTTAHAVLNLNKEDGGNRKFILIEMEDYAENITAERVKRVMQGYGEGSKAVEGTGGSFDFYELGLPIFKDDKNLNEEVSEDKIREYIYYTETKQYLTRERKEEHKYLLDTYNETGYYFYYEKNKLTTLNSETLSIVCEKAGQYLIYADICLLDANYMFRHNIIFKKIPRDIKRF